MKNPHCHIHVMAVVENKEIYEEGDYIVLTIYKMLQVIYTHKANPKSHK